MCTPSSETIKEKGQEMASEYVNFINKYIDDDDEMVVVVMTRVEMEISFSSAYPQSPPLSPLCIKYS